MPGAAPDADLKTLHLRCGSDILPALRAAGFRGDFLEHAWPYACGLPPPAEAAAAEAALQDCARFERVVIWTEHDVHDQLVLLRLLAHFSDQQTLPRLEMIAIGQWPAGQGAGRGRFLGLGQLSAPALAALWPARTPVSASQRDVGRAAWQALRAPEPGELVRLARTGLPQLPWLARALWRHLQELPDPRSGLSLTQKLALQALQEAGPLSLQALFRRVTDHTDPLPGQGDLQFRDRLFALEACRQPLFRREAAVGATERRPWTDLLAITPLGEAVLRGGVNVQSLGPAPWWVGGVLSSRFTAPLPPA